MADEHKASTLLGASPTLKSLLQSRAAALPNAIAFTYWSGGQEIDRLTFGELHAAAQAAAAQIAAHATSTRPVVLLHPPGLDFLVDFFGCIYAGRTAIPLPMPLRERERQRFDAVARLAQPSLAVTSARDTSAQALDAFRRDWDVPLLRSERGHANSADFGDLGRDDIAVIQFTSGSSAMPRGVMLPHAAVTANLAQIEQAFDFRAAERHEAVVLWLPHFHDMGLFGRLECVLAGCPCHILSPMELTKRPLRWVECITATRATVTGGPNFAFELCSELAETRDLAKLDLSSLRLAFCGAEPISAATLDRFEAAFRGCGLAPEALLPCYGLAEATLMVSSHAPGRIRTVLDADAGALARGRVATAGAAPARRLVGCGRVVSGMQVAIVDPDALAPLADGDIGEIWISGPNVCSGYLGGASAQSGFARLDGAADDAPSYLRTGDLGCLIDGELFVVGRLKDLIIVHGLNFHPHDLERLVPACHPALRAARAAALALDGPSGEIPLMIVEVPPATKADEAELRLAAEAVAGEVLRQLEIDPIHVAIVRRGALAWTTSGKLARGETALRFRRGEMQVLAEWPEPAPLLAQASNSVEDVVCGVVAAVLGRPVRHPDRGFHELGGDSLAAHRASARLRQAYGAAFDEQELLMGVPIAEIARRIDLRLEQQVQRMSDQEVADALRAIGEKAVGAICAICAPPPAGAEGPHTYVLEST
jgi:acyl-CoA synthetase (AMP-forming)/AMP-acid ligase II